MGYLEENIWSILAVVAGFIGAFCAYKALAKKNDNKIADHLNIKQKSGWFSKENEQKINFNINSGPKKDD
ncbi:hypothetical protein AB6D20_025365 [Vibrio splendidus]